MKPLTDDSLMPFGKYKGRAMKSVPADYFHWLWTEGGMSAEDTPVSRYIKSVMGALKKENPDLLWGRE